MTSAINADPYPTFKRLRDEAPIYYNEQYDFWALSRHADVEKAPRRLADVLESRGDILEIVQSGHELPPASCSGRTRRSTPSIGA